MRVVILLLAILALSAFIGCQAKPMVVSESGSESEGIKVHGDWTVEVRNPDGSLAKKVPFSNKITEKGFELLAMLMTHDKPIYDRRIWLGISNTPGPEPFDISGNYCHGDDSGWEKAMQFKSHPKVVAVISADKKGSIWSGGCTVSIENDSKTAWLRQINGMYTLEDGVGLKDNWETLSKAVPGGIEVVDGQYVSATVVYSFN